MPVNVNPFIDIQLSVQGAAVTVQYKVDPQFSGQTPFTFKLMAFQDETFQTPVYSISGSGFFIVDDTSIRQNQLPSFLYKLELATANGYKYYSSFFGWHQSDSTNRHKYLLANEIARRERVRFNYAGMYGYLLKRMTYGPNQANEVDPVTGEPVLDDTVSFGVGTNGGYYPPALVRFSIEAREAKTDYAEDGRGAQYTELLKIRTVGFPFIDQHDIVATPDGKRYTVAEANSKYFPGTTMILLQAPTLRLMPNTDTTYSITLPPFPNERAS